MLTTAGRIGALLELTWDRADLDRRIIRLAPHDIGPRRGRATVPVNDTLAAALQAAQSRFVIEWAAGKWGRSRPASMPPSPAPESRTAPRTTCGRFMAETGVPVEELATCLGHSDPHLTRKSYTQFSPDYLRSAARAPEL